MRSFKKYYIILDYFEKLKRIHLIKSRQSQINPLLALLFLIAPAVSAWAWQYREDTSKTQNSHPAVIIPRALPVEIITSDDSPKWVLVPIEPK
ncbi:MAG: hypothetical protein AB8D78_12345 [Akkermansiaceae bacterium]